MSNKIKDIYENWETPVSGIEKLNSYDFQLLIDEGIVESIDAKHLSMYERNFINAYNETDEWNKKGIIELFRQVKKQWKLSGSISREEFKELIKYMLEEQCIKCDTYDRWEYYSVIYNDFDDVNYNSIGIKSLRFMSNNSWPHFLLHKLYSLRSVRLSNKWWDTTNDLLTTLV